MTPMQSVVIALLAVGVFLSVCTAKLMHRLARSLKRFSLPCGRKTTDPWDHDGQSCRFESTDGRVFEGLLFSNAAGPSRRTVIFVPESGGDQRSVFPYLELWGAAGLDVLTLGVNALTPDSAIAPRTDHPWVTETQIEEVLAAIEHVCERQRTEEVVLMGVSRGGLAALGAAARDARVAAVVADSCYLCEDLVAHYVRRYSSAHSHIGPYLMKCVPTCVLSWHGRLALRRVLADRNGGYPRLHRLLRSLKQPVLLIHGNRDNWVPHDVASRLERRLPRATMWLVDGGGHTNSIHIAPNEYRDRVGQFAELNASELETQPSRVGA